MFQLSIAFNCKTFKCKIPKGCTIGNFNFITEYLNYEKIFKKRLSMRCDLKSGFPFEFDGSSTLLNKNDSCLIDYLREDSFVTLKWPTKELNILNSTFQISNLFDYLDYFKMNVFLGLFKLKGFDINLLEDNSNGSLFETMLFIC